MVHLKLHPEVLFPNYCCFQQILVFFILNDSFCLQEKLFSSKNRTEASLGKKLKNDMLPEIEKVHKVANY